MGHDQPLQLDDLTVGTDREAAWATLRQHGPAVAMADQLYVLGFAEAEHTLRDAETFSSQLLFGALGSPVPLVPIAFDPPEHTRYHRVLQPHLTPKRADEVLERVHHRLVELIDSMVARGGGDVVADVGVPFPGLVFLSLFGLPAEDLDRLLVWKDSILRAQSPSPDAPELDLAAPTKLIEYLSGQIAARRADPGDDMLSRLVHDSSDEALDDDEILGMAFLFVLAGLDSVSGAIGFAVTRLAEDPTLHERLRADPTLVPAYVEESLRLDPGDFALPRIATRDTTVGGCPLAAGTVVGVVLSTANRDPERFADPLAVDLARTGARHLGFGYGVHRCIGLHLARAELCAFVAEWTQRVPAFTIEAGFEPSLAWPASLLHHACVRVTIDA